MKMDYITFRSITPAQRGQRILQHGGIETMLMRTPRWMEERGGGYCLRLKPENREQAVLLLQQTQIPYSRVYPYPAEEEAAP